MQLEALNKSASSWLPSRRRRMWSLSSPADRTHTEGGRTRNLGLSTIRSSRATAASTRARIRLAPLRATPRQVRSPLRSRSVQSRRFYFAPPSRSAQSLRPSRDSFLPSDEGTAGVSGDRLCETNCSLRPLTAYTCAPVGPKAIFAFASTPSGNFSETTRMSSSVIETPPMGSTNLLQRWLIQGSACQAALAAFHRRLPRTCATFDRSADKAAAVVAARGILGKLGGIDGPA